MSNVKSSILFVCMGNICRSPALEATLRHLAAQRGKSSHFFIDSCGLGWFHLGQHPDPRTFEAAKKHGILIDHRAQQLQDEHFDLFDLILAVDLTILEQLKLRAAGSQNLQKIHLVTEFSRKFKDEPIADPYYMGADGFDKMMEVVIDSCEGLLDSLD